MEYQGKLEPLREELNRALEYRVGGVGGSPRCTDESWQEEAQELHRKWRELRIARQRGMDASIAAQGRVRVPV